MLHRDNFLSRHNDLATETATIICKGFPHLSGQMLLAAALVALPMSASIAKGQTNKPQDDAPTATVHTQVCEGQTPDSQHNLSTKSGTKSAFTEEDEGTHFDSASAKKPLRLSGVQDSTDAADQEGAQCKRPHTDAPKQWRPQDSPGSNQPVSPQADSTAPIVTYSGGQLMVVGHGARLGQILDTIKALTGITLEVPPESADNQIFDDVGPAPARQALMQLLDGTKLNYVILSSSEDPQRVKELILTAQAGMMPPNTLGSAKALPTEQASGPALYGAGFSEASSEAAVIEPVPNTASTAPVNASIQQAASASGKTPGQILDELQKKQLQQLDQQAAQSAPQ
jgi:hypothetical protein